MLTHLAAWRTRDLALSFDSIKRSVWKANGPQRTGFPHWGVAPPFVWYKEPIVIEPEKIRDTAGPFVCYETPTVIEPEKNMFLYWAHPLGVRCKSPWFILDAPRVSNVIVTSVVFCL